MTRARARYDVDLRDAAAEFSRRYWSCTPEGQALIQAVRGALPDNFTLHALCYYAALSGPQRVRAINTINRSPCAKIYVRKFREAVDIVRDRITGYLEHQAKVVDHSPVLMFMGAPDPESHGDGIGKDE